MGRSPLMNEVSLAIVLICTPKADTPT
jgi:hypothetical protein